MPEAFGHDFHVDPGNESERGPGVAEVMQPDHGEVGERGLPHLAVERLREGLRMLRAAVGAAEHEIMVLVPVADE
jgi:hypothetical protein